MFEYNKLVEAFVSITTTIVSIMKSEMLINRIGVEKFGLMIMVIIIATLITLSDSPKEDR